MAFASPPSPPFRHLLSHSLLLLALFVLKSFANFATFELLKSEIQPCVTGDLQCSRKLVVEIKTWQGWNIGAEDAIFVIDSAKDLAGGTGNLSYFQNPFGIRVQKTEALIHYPLKFFQLVAAVSTVDDKDIQENLLDNLLPQYESLVELMQFTSNQTL